MSLTGDDLKKIALLINTGLGNLKSYIDEKFAESYRLLPTKEEFFARMDKVSGEYKKIDEAEMLQDGKISQHSDELENHEERIKVLEQRKTATPIPISSIG